MGVQEIGSNSGAVDVSSLLRSRTVDTSAAARQTGQPAAEKAGGAPPAGGGGAKPSAASDSASSSSNSSKVYDPRDLNRDGVVSADEELMFALKAQAAEKKDQTGATSSQIQSGLNAYKQNQAGQSESPAMGAPGISV